MELLSVKIEKPEDMNFILGQSHFIKTVEDMHEALVCAVPGIQFGLAFCEASVFDGDGQLCAHGTGTFKYVRALPAKGRQLKVQRQDGPRAE